jgi:LacI family transcriptional regulator
MGFAWENKATQSSFLKSSLDDPQTWATRKSKGSQASPSPRKVHRVALLFNANQIYDREIIGGIGDYFRSTRVEWDIFVEDDVNARLNGLSKWEGDGIIANFDDPTICNALRGSKVPVVAVGGSYEDPQMYPATLPYVATDNFKLIKMAQEHLIEASLPHLALYSLPESPMNRWAQEREKAFQKLEPKGRIYRGATSSSQDWGSALAQLIDWIASLPKPVGIIATNDNRARHLMQACSTAGISVPEEVAIVGIDNDPLTHSLLRIGLSSVRQGTTEMGRTAARFLHELLQGARLQGTQVIVPPVGLNALASTLHTQAYSPMVMRATHFIRQQACHGVRAEQVASYAGVSRSTMESGFRKYLGTTVHSVLLKHRLEVACDLLRNSDFSLVEIAKRSGFKTTQYMHVAFKRELATTPSEWRNRAIN